MPRLAKESSAIAVRNLSHPDHGGIVANAVGGVTGLYSQITPNRARSCLLRYAVSGARYSMGGGSFPVVSLARARGKVRDARELMRSGGDTLGEKRAMQEACRFTVAFADAAFKTIKTKASECGTKSTRCDGVPPSKLAPHQPWVTWR